MLTLPLELFSVPSKEILIILVTKIYIPPDEKCYCFHKYLAYKINDLNNSAHLHLLLAGSGM